MQLKKMIDIALKDNPLGAKEETSSAAIIFVGKHGEVRAIKANMTEEYFKGLCAHVQTSKCLVHEHD